MRVKDVLGRTPADPTSAKVIKTLCNCTDRVRE